MEKSFEHIVSDNDITEFANYLNSKENLVSSYGFSVAERTAKSVIPFASESFFDDVVDHVITVWYGIFLITRG